MKILLLIFLAIAGFSQASGQQPAKPVEQKNAKPSLNLHVPSPEWRDQIIYFLMIDRFNDGDSGNNDQGKNEYDPSDSRKFSGGDLEGVIQKLDYIKNLGATAIWITPPIANQWWDPVINYGGYHGYWAENFKEIDVHFGTLEMYKNLSHELHQRGMYLIQDIVLNHTGNFFEYQGGFNPDSLSEYFSINTQSVPTSAPTQFPFNMNDVTNSEHRGIDAYNWTPAISDYADPRQKLRYQMASLDDINTKNPMVRAALRDSYGYWIKEVGVDGFRIDTIIYVELSFWHDFMFSTNEQAPGMNLVAGATGRGNFLTFGEAFIKSAPMSDEGEIEVASYLGTAEKPALNSMLNYPLFYTINRVFGQGLPTSFMSFRLNAAVNSGVFKNPFILPAFIDNHDWNRFITAAKPAALKQALMFLFTIPGIPVIYQGTEQLFKKDRTAMFASGWDAGGKDHFIETSEMYLFIKELAKLRITHKIFTRGRLKILQDSNIGQGVFAFMREYNDEKAVVIFNTADQPILMSNLETGLAQGAILHLAKGLGMRHDLVAGPNGSATYELPQRSAGIFFVSDEKAEAKHEKLNAEIVTEISGRTFSNDFTLNGKVAESDSDYLLVVDGKIDQSIALKPDASGNWQTTVPISRFPFGKTSHSLNIYSPGESKAAEALPFETEVEIRGTRVTFDDPLNDDHGPFQNYIKPMDASYGGQMDIDLVEVVAFGANLRIELTMAEISDPWLPTYGYDHVSFHIFIDLPNASGQTILPKLNAKAPDGFAWDYVYYGGGWSNGLFSSKNSNENDFGAIVTPTPSIQVDKTAKKITFQFSPEALGNPAALKGAKIYITTWDNTGSAGLHRAITKEGALFEFGGSDDPNAPLILDETKVIFIQ